MKGKGPLLYKLPRATAMRPLSRRGKRKLMDSQAGDSDGFGWGSVPVVLPGVATAAGNAPGARQGWG